MVEEDKYIYKARDLAGRSFHVAFGRRGSIGTLWIQYYYDICEVTKCPIEPGPFVLTLANLNFAQSNYRSVSFSVHTCINTSFR